MNEETGYDNDERPRKLVILMVILALLTALALAVALWALLKPCGCAVTAGRRSSEAPQPTATEGDPAPPVGSASPVLPIQETSPSTRKQVDKPVARPTVTAFVPIAIRVPTVPLPDTSVPDTSVPDTPRPNALSGITIQAGEKFVSSEYRFGGASLPYLDLSARSSDVLFDFVPSLKNDGTFEIRAGDGTCLTYLWGHGVCNRDRNASSSWYLQPTSRDGAFVGTAADELSLYRIRSVEDDLCMSFDRNNSAPGFKPGTCAYEDPKTGLVSSGFPVAQQKLVLHSPSNEALLQGSLLDLATHRAVSQPSAHSPIVAVTTIQLDASAPLTLGEYSDVTTAGQESVNRTSSPSSFTLNWRKTNGSVISAGAFPSAFSSSAPRYAVTTWQLGLDGQIPERGPGATSGKAQQTINAQQSGWIMQAGPVRNATAYWGFATDLGDVWTGKVFLTIDVPETAGSGVSTRTIFCTTDSTDPVCIASRKVNS